MPGESHTSGSRVSVAAEPGCARAGFYVWMLSLFLLAVWAWVAAWRQKKHAQ